MKKITSLAAIAILSSSLLANADVQTQIDELTKEISKLKKAQKSTKKSLSKVKKATGGDNVKFNIDFRNTVDVLEYKNNETGEIKRNSSLLTSRLYLNMAATPMDGLIFKGKLAIYNTWGSEPVAHSAGFKDWAGSSKATDTIMRVKEAYFVYSTDIGAQPISVSVGRRLASNGFLANYRENEKESGSPLAHITNMEVNAMMAKLSWDRYVEGAYSKFIYGRAHSGEMEGVFGNTPSERTPFAQETAVDNENVDFFIFLGDAYNNAQYQVMYEWAHIFNTKGVRLHDNKTKAASGTADLLALSFKIDGIGDEINDFLDDTTAFASVAISYYDAKNGYSLVGSTDGGISKGYSYWLGAVFPDMITDSGKFGLEYNHGSQNWTPMTWAEDTAMGSKIAVRGDAYEAYWNFNLFGVKYLPSQVRYTYAQHDYTPNINCSGWVKPVAVDITASDLRVSVSYRY